MCSIVVTGHAASGQDEIAAAVSAHTKRTLLTGNKFLYESGSLWVKVPTDVFVSRVHDAALEATTVLSGIPAFVYHSTYMKSIPNDPRTAAIEMLCFKVWNRVRPLVVVIDTPSVEEGLTNLLQRSLDRAAGKRAGVCAETPASVAEMVLQFIQNFKEEEKALEQLADTARASGCYVVKADATRVIDHLTQLGLLPCPSPSSAAAEPTTSSDRA